MHDDLQFKITPTRELAIQIFVAAHPFCKSVGSICLSGRNNYHQQGIQLFNGIDIVVCTPGRLIQPIEKRNKDLHRSFFIVFDEADRLYFLSFRPQVISVIDTCCPDRRTLMFSAKFGSLSEEFAREALTNPLKLIAGTTKTPTSIIHRNPIRT